MRNDAPIELEFGVLLETGPDGNERAFQAIAFLIELGEIKSEDAAKIVVSQL